MKTHLTFNYAWRLILPLFLVLTTSTCSDFNSTNPGKDKKSLISSATNNNNLYNLKNQKPTKIGDRIEKNYESPHPYKGNQTNNYKLVWKQEINAKNASYVAVHFKKIELYGSDYIVIKNPEGNQTWQYTAEKLANRQMGFWSVPVLKNKMVIEIHSKNSNGNYGYTIDQIAKGFPKEDSTNIQPQAICGSDDSENAVCYENNEPEIYDHSRAVARLIINGVEACTGWLVGDEGHLMTNQHCIQDQNDANNVTVEFMAEGSNCSSDCETPGACPGTVAASSATLVKTSYNLDYTLLRLPTNVSNTYGFLQMRRSGAELSERIYIPGHPAAWGKRISVYSDNSQDGSGFAEIQSLSQERCGSSRNGNDIGYYADTRGGSSGSPVIAYQDNFVIALHHCANCQNRGVPIEQIINDLGNDLPHNAVGAYIDGLGLVCNNNAETYELKYNLTNTTS